MEEKIVNLFKRGVSLRDIVRDLHIDHYTAWQALVKARLDSKAPMPNPKAKKRYFKVTPDVEKLVLDMRREGYTIQSIHDRSGISTSQINRIIKRNGLTSPQKHLEDTDAKPEPQAPIGVEQSSVMPEEQAVLEAQHALEVAKVRLEIAKLEAKLAEARAHLDSL